MMLIKTRSASIVYLIHASVVIRTKIFLSFVVLFFFSFLFLSMPREENKECSGKKKTLTTCNVVFYCNMLLLSRKVPSTTSNHLSVSRFFFPLSFSRTAIVHYFEKRAKEKESRRGEEKTQDQTTRQFSQ